MVVIFFVFLNEWLIDWLIDCLIDWLTDWLTDKWPTDKWNNQSTDWFTEYLYMVTSSIMNYMYFGDAFQIQNKML